MALHDAVGYCYRSVGAVFVQFRANDTFLGAILRVRRP